MANNGKNIVKVEIDGTKVLEMIKEAGYSIRGMAEKIGYGDRTLRNYINKGELPAPMLNAIEGVLGRSLFYDCKAPNEYVPGKGNNFLFTGEPELFKTFLDSRRMLVAFRPDKEGIIEIRRGVSDLGLGDKKYAQVRIRIDDGERYIKGMAIYSDKIPEGYDLVYYTGRLKDTLIIGEKTKPSMKATCKKLEIIDPPGDWSKWAMNLSEKAKHLKTVDPPIPSSVELRTILDGFSKKLCGQIVEAIEASRKNCNADNEKDGV